MKHALNMNSKQPGSTVKTELASIAQRYLYEWHLNREIFQKVALNSYQNARENPNASLENLMKDYQKTTADFCTLGAL
jgi:acetyl-CoA acetyltransferase